MLVFQLPWEKNGLLFLVEEQAYNNIYVKK